MHLVSFNLFEYFPCIPVAHLIQSRFSNCASGHAVARRVDTLRNHSSGMVYTLHREIGKDSQENPYPAGLVTARSKSWGWWHGSWGESRFSDIIYVYIRASSLIFGHTSTIVESVTNICL
jgi:hypothetical protein